MEIYTSICEHLEISCPTYYRYIDPEVKAEQVTPTIKTMQVWLWLRVENNNKFIRRKKKVREHIEQFCLTRYQMKKKKTDGYEYELTFTYEDDEDLDKQIYDLLQEMDFQADLKCCFIEADVREIGTELLTISISAPLVQVKCLARSRLLIFQFV